MRLLDHNAGGDPTRLREVLSNMEGSVDSLPERIKGGPVASDISAEEIVDRLELLLESRRKDRQLAESEERYRSMVESMNFPVCRWKPDTTLTYVNKAYANLFSTMEEDLIGRKWIEFVPEERRSAVWTLISDVIRRAEPEATMHESIDKEGNRRFQEWWDCPILDERGEVVELHAFGRDLTEVKTLERRNSHLEGMISRLLQLCDYPILVFNSKGRIFERNPSVQVHFRETGRRDQLTDLFPSLSLKRFQRLLDRLEQEDKLYVSVSGPAGDFKMRIRSLQDGPDGERYLALLESDTDIHESGTVHLNPGSPGDSAFPRKTGKKARELAFNAIKTSFLEAGPSLRVERVFLYSRNTDGTTWKAVSEWMEDGLVPLHERLPEISAEAFNWFDKRMRRGEAVQIDSVNRLPRTAVAEQEQFSEMQISSLLALPLVKDDGGVFGFIGLAQTRSGRLWHREEISALEALRDEVCGFLEGS